MVTGFLDVVGNHVFKRKYTLDTITVADLNLLLSGTDLA